MISAATVLSSLACLSLAGAYQRFLPVAGNRSLRLILSGYGLITGTSILLGTAFVTLGFGSSIFTSTTDRVLFVPLVLVLAIYAITDPILIGLRRSPPSPSRTSGCRWSRSCRCSSCRARPRRSPSPDRGWCWPR